MKSKPRLLPIIVGLLICSQAWAQPEPVSPEVQTYDQLVHALREVRHTTQERIDAAVDAEKMRQAWQTGTLIREHILLNKDRADYGRQVMLRLSADLGTSVTDLSYMREFSQTYPDWSQVPPGVNWSHMELLLAVNDAAQRQALAAESAAKKWSFSKLRHEIKMRKLVASGLLAEKLPEIKPGKIGAYQIVEINGKKYYDLGFSFYIEVKAPKQKTSSLKKLYTYKAQVTQVYDGDTFHARINLGSGRMTQQRLRLRRIDAPELESSDGQEAKAYLEKILARDKNKILIKVFDIDQHGRPLVDVFIPAKSSKPDERGRSRMGEDYINIDQELLDQGLATRMEE